MTINTIDGLLADLWIFHTALMGISITVFTLVYSFIVNKREELKMLSSILHKNSSDPLLIQKQRFAVVSLRRFKKINRYFIWAISSTFILFLSSWLCLRLVDDSLFCLKKTFLVILLSLTCVLLFVVIYAFVKLVRIYQNETAI